jgi:hypothetical protein
MDLVGSISAQQNDSALHVTRTLENLLVRAAGTNAEKCRALFGTRGSPFTSGRPTPRPGICGSRVSESRIKGAPEASNGFGAVERGAQAPADEVSSVAKTRSPRCSADIRPTRSGIES